MEHIHLIQKHLRRKNIDAVLVSQPENRQYLSGYSALDTSISESSGHLLIPKSGEPFLLTDFRFQQQATEETTNFTISIYQKGLLQLLENLISKLALKTLAYEAHYFLCSNLSHLDKIAKKLTIQTIPITNLVEKIRLHKNSHELTAISKSVSLNEAVFQEIFPLIKPGMSEIDVAIQIENCMRHRGAERPSFETIVAGGPNGAKPHAVPSSRKLQCHEPIIIDMGLVLDGYCSDMTRTIVLDTPDTKTIEIIRLVRAAQLAALHSLKPSITCRSVDQTARNIIKQAGYGKSFGHALGHGVGLAVHEAPSLSSRNRSTLKPGMVITIEPGVYLPGWGGVRLENMVAITQEGYSLLNNDTTFLDI